MRAVIAGSRCAARAATAGRSALQSERCSLVASVSSASSDSYSVFRSTAASHFVSQRAFASLVNVIPRASPSVPREHRAPPPPLPAPKLLRLQSENCSIEYIDLPAPHSNLEHGAHSSAAPSRRATIVAMHGAPGTYRDFRHIIPLLQQQTHVSLRVIGVNLPGFGGSVVDSERYVDAVSALPAASATLRALQELCASDENVFLMGHSFGAHAAINIAALNQESHSREPLHVKGMVLLAPAGCRPHRVLRPKHNAVVVDLLRSANPVVMRTLAALTKFLYTKMLGFSSDFPASHYVAGIVRAGTTDFETVTDHVLATKHTTPAFLAWSSSDEYMEDAVPTELARMCHPGGPRVAFTGGGHNIQKTRADFLADEVVQWVREVLDGTSSSSSDSPVVLTSSEMSETTVQVHP